jgi:hypothetical protein
MNSGTAYIILCLAFTVFFTASCAKNGRPKKTSYSFQHPTKDESTDQNAAPSEETPESTIEVEAPGVPVPAPVVSSDGENENTTPPKPNLPKPTVKIENVQIVLNRQTGDLNFKGDVTETFGDKKYETKLHLFGTLELDPSGVMSGSLFEKDKETLASRALGLALCDDIGSLRDPRQKFPCLEMSIRVLIIPQTPNAANRPEQQFRVLFPKMTAQPAAAPDGQGGSTQEVVAGGDADQTPDSTRAKPPTSGSGTGGAAGTPSQSESEQGQGPIADDESHDGHNHDHESDPDSSGEDEELHEDDPDDIYDEPQTVIPLPAEPGIVDSWLEQNEVTVQEYDYSYVPTESEEVYDPSATDAPEPDSGDNNERTSTPVAPTPNSPTPNPAADPATPAPAPGAPTTPPAVANPALPSARPENKPAGTATRRQSTLLPFNVEFYAGGLAVGLPNRNGRISGGGGGTLVPERGRGFERKPDDNAGKIGNGFSISVFKGAAAEFKKRHPECPDWVVTEISKRNGGRMKGHKSHQNGNDIDLRYSARNWRSQCNWKLYILLSELKINNSTPLLNKIFVDPVIFRAYCQEMRNTRNAAEKQKKKNALRFLFPVSKHYDHMHVRVQCSPTHRGCRNPTYRNKESMCQ